MRNVPIFIAVVGFHARSSPFIPRPREEKGSIDIGAINGGGGVDMEAKLELHSAARDLRLTTS